MASARGESLEIGSAASTKYWCSCGSACDARVACYQRTAAGNLHPLDAAVAREVEGCAQQIEVRLVRDVKRHHSVRQIAGQRPTGADRFLGHPLAARFRLHSVAGIGFDLMQVCLVLVADLLERVGCQKSAIGFDLWLGGWGFVFVDQTAEDWSATYRSAARLCDRVVWLWWGEL